MLLSSIGHVVPRGKPVELPQSGDFSELIVPLKTARENAVLDFVESAMILAEGDHAKAASRLQITVRSLYRYLAMAKRRAGEA